MAVLAVSCELVSGAKFPLTGKNTGNLPTGTASLFDFAQCLWACQRFLVDFAAT